jgi:DNA-binding NarL/FixJ family response regulator
VSLTPREKEILEGLVRGMSTRDMAGELFVSPTTVRNHVASLLKKLDVHSRLAAVALAHELGLVS